MAVDEPAPGWSRPRVPELTTFFFDRGCPSGKGGQPRCLKDRVAITIWTSVLAPPLTLSPAAATISQALWSVSSYQQRLSRPIPRQPAPVGEPEAGAGRPGLPIEIPAIRRDCKRSPCAWPGD